MIDLMLALRRCLAPREGRNAGGRLRLRHQVQPLLERAEGLQALLLRVIVTLIDGVVRIVRRVDARN